MKWLLPLVIVLLSGCSVITGRGLHVQAHGKLFLNVTELQTDGGGMIFRFADDGRGVICSPAGCVIGVKGDE